ncbi:MAG: hypothetical protein QM703_01985 [Gemmatales bacterium]
MKLHWHLLFLFLATLTAIVSWLLLSEPLWEQTGHDAAYYVTHHQTEGELVSLLVRNQRSTYTVETRDLLDGRILKTVDLDLPGQRYLPVIVPHDQKQPGEHELVVIGFPGVIKNGSGGNFAIKIFDALTGKSLTNELFGVMADADFGVRGEKVAIPTPTQLLLFDSRTRQLRKFELAEINSAHISPDGNWVAVTQKSALLILDWESGKVLASQKLRGRKYKLSFDRQGSLTLLGNNPGILLSRWKWDGREIKVLKKETRIEMEAVMSLDQIDWCEDGNGNWHITNGRMRNWPQQYRALCERLVQWGFMVSSYIEMQFIKTGLTLNENFETISRYEEPYYGSLNINDKVDVEYTNPAISNGSIMVRRHGPLLPNALAIGMVVYLLIYVMVRCMRPRPSGP